MSILAMGDIHGEITLLEKLLENVPSVDSLVFLGDYIDRGRYSKEVVLLIEELYKSKDVILLCGNHEEMFIEAIAEKDFRGGMLSLWLQNGGIKTIESFSGRKVDMTNFQPSLEMCQNFYAAHRTFFSSLVDFYQNENFFFVHAGVDPLLPPHEQARETLLWARSSFLNQAKEAFAGWPFLIHGHTPLIYDNEASSPEHSHRLNLNGGCGCGYEGTLRAVILPEKRLIEVGRGKEGKLFVREKRL